MQKCWHLTKKMVASSTLFVAMAVFTVLIDMPSQLKQSFGASLHLLIVLKINISIYLENILQITRHIQFVTQMYRNTLEHNGYRLGMYVCMLKMEYARWNILEIFLFLLLFLVKKR